MADKGKAPLEEGESSRRPYQRAARIGYARRACIGIWLEGIRELTEVPPPVAPPAAEPVGQSQAPPVAEPVGHVPVPPAAEPLGRPPVPGPVLVEERPMLVEVNLRGTEHQVSTSTVHVQIFRPAMGVFEEEADPRPQGSGAPPVGVPPPDRADADREQAPRPREGGAVHMGSPVAAPREEEEESEEDPEEGPIIPDPAEPWEDPQDLGVGVELGAPEAEVPQEAGDGEDDQEVEGGGLGGWLPWEGDDDMEDVEEDEAVGWGAASPEPTSTITTASTVSSD